MSVTVADVEPIVFGPNPRANDSQERDDCAFGLVDSAAFAAMDPQVDWLVHGILVRGQPALIGGPQKSLKTTIAIDLALSIATGTDFLGHFAVGETARVGLFSGESGVATLQETAHRISEAKDCALAEVDMCWAFHLPRLSRKKELASLGSLIRDQGLEVVTIDPLYLCLLAGNHKRQASNRYDIGPLLSAVTETCLNAGATPIFVHHMKKTVKSRSPLGLDGLAFAGVGEFARQWLLLNRREPFQWGSGRHQLWFAAGRSMGHSGCWEVNVEEGI